ncbi:MAG: carboxypeptidase regulatory-like domain-containing protein [Bacteroidota bacterium]
MRIFVLTTAMLLPLLVQAGDVNGKVFFKGNAPRQARINMAGDPRCMALHKEPVYAEDVIVNQNGTLENVVITVKSGLPGKKYPTPSEKVIFNQDGCRYIPHVVAMMVGQTLEIVNDDPTLHNVHTLSKLNSPFNIAQPKKGMRLDRSFDRVETFKVKCEVHPWMAAYIAVLDNPYFSVTGKDGEFTIKGLPAGEYVLEAWHERYGTKTFNVKIGPKGSTTANVTYEMK